MKKHSLSSRNLREIDFPSESHDSSRLPVVPPSTLTHVHWLTIEQSDRLCDQNEHLLQLWFNLLGAGSELPPELRANATAVLFAPFTESVKKILVKRADLVAKNIDKIPVDRKKIIHHKNQTFLATFLYHYNVSRDPTSTQGYKITAQCFDPTKIPEFLTANFNDFHQSIEAKSIDEIADTILENLMLFHLRNLIAAFNHPYISSFFNQTMNRCVNNIESAMRTRSNIRQFWGALFPEQEKRNPSPDSVAIVPT